MSEYVVVARRYRPQTFQEVVGNETVTRTLSTALDTNRVSHAYLFVGGRGMGKTSTARITAKALNCEKGTSGNPCGTCRTCQDITNGNSPDVVEIDAASNRGVDEIRKLKELVHVQPTFSKYKVYVIDEVHMLTKEAFNALLKTLEEPPKHCKFIFCTTELEKVPDTIRSRCQIHQFQPATLEQLTESLRGILVKEGVSFDEEVLTLVARRSGGSLRDSQSLLDQLLAFGSNPITLAEAMALFGVTGDSELLDIVTSIGRRDTKQALEICDKTLAKGADVGTLTNQITMAFRDLMICKLDCPSYMYLQLSPISHTRVKEIVSMYELEQLIDLSALFAKTTDSLRYAPIPKVLLEIALVKSCKPAFMSEPRSSSNQASLVVPLNVSNPSIAPVSGNGSTQPVKLIETDVRSNHPFLKRLQELFGGRIERRS